MCSYPHCMQLYGGCGQGCTDALATRSRKRLRSPEPFKALPAKPEVVRMLALVDELRRQIAAIF